MENNLDKTIYVYQLSLADGKIVIHESDGFFSSDSSDDNAEKVLINSATLIKVISKENTKIVEDNISINGESEPVEVELVS